jgi:hypothetical protein
MISPTKRRGIITVTMVGSAMLTILILLSCNQSSAGDLLDRYVAFRKKSPFLEARFSVKSGAQECTGHSISSGTTRLKYEMVAPGLNFQSSVGPEGTVDLNLIDLEYDELPGRPWIKALGSNLSNAPDLFPTFLLADDLRKLSKAPFKNAGPNHLTSHSDSGGSSLDLDVVMAEDGGIRSFGLESKSIAGNRSLKWVFSTFTPVVGLSPKSFELPIPVGYIPYSLPNREGPLAVGVGFPTEGWRDRGGKAIPLLSSLGHKGGLVALLSSDSDPSSASRKSLVRFKGQVPVVILGDSPTISADAYDSSGKLLATVSAPATPLFALLDHTGKIRKLWMGYDAENPGPFESAVKSEFVKLK